MKLFELTEQYRALSKLEESDELPADVIRDTLEGLEGDLADKVKAVAAVIQNIEADADATQAAANAMTARSKRTQKRADSLREYLLFHCQAVGKLRFEFPEFTIAVRDNPESVKIADDAVLPAEFMVQPEPPPPAPDKKALKIALKAGREIRGAWLERGQRMEIKV